MQIKDNTPFPNTLRNAVHEIKQSIQRSQARALQSVNREVLSLYYGVGRYVSENSRQGTWGTSAVKLISQQLQKEMPGLTGFSESSIKNMRRFYECWNDTINRQPLAAEFTWDDFLAVPFTHHIEIIRHCDTLEERTFYIHQCATRAWSKYALRDFMQQNLYKDRGTLPSNFLTAIPDTKRALRTLKAFKENYLLNFINAEDLYESDEERNEPMLNNKIVEHIRDFILRFGQDFMFVGPQYRLVSGNDEKFVDLLFFNRQLNCLVAVELKDCRFQPAHLGQLAFYLTLLDRQVRKPHENPSIGLILCREMDKTTVELAIQDYTKPMGVATFRLGVDAPEQYSCVLPDMQGLSELINEEK